MDKGELHIEIDWGSIDKTGVSLICGNCHHAVENYTSENIFFVPVRIH